MSWEKPRFRSRIAALDRGLEADALNLEILDEAGGNAGDHVVDQRAGEAVQRADLAVFAAALDV